MARRRSSTTSCARAKRALHSALKALGSSTRKRSRKSKKRKGRKKGHKRKSRRKSRGCC